ncbi:MAG: insulinase family protein [Caldilineaceae bacterium]|nr:insulinase family protein [Caldilineaceae bacterium]
MNITSNALPNSDNITRVVFANGLTVLVRENHAAPVVVVEGYIPAGAIHEPTEKAGLSSFVASMLTRGSAHYDFDHFNETIESIGASLGAGTSDHFTNFNATSLAEDFPTILTVLADILRRPQFPAVHMERVRQQKLVRLQERTQDTSQMANLRFYEAIYGDHPYGRSTSGYVETIAQIQASDLAAFHASRYTPQGAILVVVGAVETQAVLDLVHAHFGDWQGAPAEKQVPPFPAPQRGQRIHSPIPGKVQADINLGVRAIPRHHPDFYAIRVANNILGQFGMMGRLGERVREEQGLAYYSYTSVDTDLHNGVWLAQAGVNPANVEQAIQSILTEFERMATTPVTAEELADSQAYMTGVLPLTLETNSGVASTLLMMEWFELGLDYLERYPSLINAITAADVQRVAAQYLQADACTIVVAGP